MTRAELGQTHCALQHCPENDAPFEGCQSDAETEERVLAIWKKSARDDKNL